MLIARRNLMADAKKPLFAFPREFATRSFFYYPFEPGKMYEMANNGQYSQGVVDGHELQVISDSEIAWKSAAWYGPCVVLPLAVGKNYAMSFSSNTMFTAAALKLKDDGKMEWIKNFVATTSSKNVSFTVPEGCDYVAFTWMNGSAGDALWVKDVVLNAVGTEFAGGGGGINA